MTMARFPRTETMNVRHGDRELNAPAFLAFVWAVNEAAETAGGIAVFGKPVTRPNDPHPGYETEHYVHARVIHGPADEGVRVVADADWVADLFRVAAGKLGIHLATPS